MASQLDKLVEAITELVVRELEQSQGSAEPSAPRIQPAEPALQNGVTPILVAAGPSEVDQKLWACLTQVEKARYSALVWNGFRKDQLPPECSGWKLETRTVGWQKVVHGYKGVCLLGSDLSVLSSVAHLGAGALPPAGVAVAAISSGLPVFIEEQHFERLRRHSARLPSGFVRRFEETWQTVSSFGVEFGGAEALSGFLARCTAGGRPEAVVSSRGGGRDVVTVEDVEAARRAGQTVLAVAVGTIVTPLARQRAGEWGVEVKFQ